MRSVGVIGGSGVYDLAGLTSAKELRVETPFGAPSDALITGELGGYRVVFLSRHGRGHRVSPTFVNYRANVYALKSLGVDTLIAVSAVGSLHEDKHPGDVVLADQFIDRTTRRESSFFGEGLVAHVSMAEPTCAELRGVLGEAVQSAGVRRHDGGTYVCIEGPAFSSRAESEMWRRAGADVIGMTAMPEAKLARECELHYATLALVTDYDCWHPGHDDVTVEAVIGILRKNADNVRKILERAIPRVAELPAPTCRCSDALRDALITSKDAVDEAVRVDLHAIVHKYFTK